MKRGSMEPLFMTVAKFSPRRCGDFTGRRIDNFIRRWIGDIRTGVLAAARGIIRNHSSPNPRGPRVLQVGECAPSAFRNYR
jgi:hypothetical protein